MVNVLQWAVMYGFSSGFPTIEWYASYVEAVERAAVLGGDAIVRST